MKTRIQLEPEVYNKGFIGGFRQVIQKEGAGALLTGLGPTAAGYFLQGAFKFVRDSTSALEPEVSLMFLSLRFYRVVTNTGRSSSVSVLCMEWIAMSSSSHLAVDQYGVAKASENRQVICSLLPFLALMCLHKLIFPASYRPHLCCYRRILRRYRSLPSRGHPYPSRVPA